MITIQATGPFAAEAERDIASFLQYGSTDQFITSVSVGPILVTVESEDELTKFWI
jgi:hypothetical protein